MIIDEVLYERFWNGEKTAADELVHRHGDMLVLFLNSYVKDIHEAEDLMSRRTVRVYVSAVLFLALKAVMFSLCKVE